MSEQLIQILLVEDNPADARLIHELLRDEAGGEVTLHHVDTLGEGVRQLHALSPDIVLLDLSLPDSRGFETFHTAHAHAPAIPFIVLTHLDDAEHALKTLHAGAQDYLVKGEVDSHLLMRAIRYAIERKKVEEKLEQYAEELRVKNAQLTDDLNMAREVQQALLPQSYPAFPPDVDPAHSALCFCHRYRPSTVLGGDFFHVDALSSVEAGVFVCDVMGHGIRAALVTAIVRGLLEKHRAVAWDPGELLAAINGSLAAVFRQTDQLMFASAFYFLINMETGEMKWSNAGHPLPVLVSGAASRACLMPVRGTTHGPGLGLFPHSVYKTYSQQVAADDLIVLYTDGLTEAVNHAGEQFGVSRLLQVIQEHADMPVETLFENILAHTEAFTGSETFEDDICLVGTKVKAHRA